MDDHNYQVKASVRCETHQYDNCTFNDSSGNWHKGWGFYNGDRAEDWGTYDYFVMSAPDGRGPDVVTTPTPAFTLHIKRDGDGSGGQWHLRRQGWYAAQNTRAGPVHPTPSVAHDAKLGRSSRMTPAPLIVSTPSTSHTPSAIPTAPIQRPTSTRSSLASIKPAPLRSRGWSGGVEGIGTDASPCGPAPTGSSMVTCSRATATAATSTRSPAPTKVAVAQGRRARAVTPVLAVATRVDTATRPAAASSPRATLRSACAPDGPR